MKAWSDYRADSLAVFGASYALVLSGCGCVYCGGVARVRDHVPPLRFVHAVGQLADRKLYAACWRCNALLGPHVALCLAERADFLLSAYRAEYRQVLGAEMCEGTRKKRLLAIAGKARRLKRRLASGQVRAVCCCRACAKEKPASISRGGLAVG